MDKWEYKRLENHNLEESDLNNLGSQGWELAGIEHHKYGQFYLFKRKISEPTQQQTISQPRQQQQANRYQVPLQMEGLLY